MRIALVVDHDIGLLNGASFQSRQFINWLVTRGHDVHLVFPSKERQCDFDYGDKVTCYTVPSFSVPAYKEYSVPLPPLAVRLWLKKWNVDLIHAETINPTLLPLAYWMKYRTGAPLFNVLTANVPIYSRILFPNPIVRKSAFAIGKSIMNWIANRIEGTFVLSEGMKKVLTEDFFSVDQNKVFTLMRPMNFERFSAGSDEETVFDWLGVPKGKRLVTLSRLCPTKNVAFLLRAFAHHIYPRYQDLHFFVGGYGPREEYLKELAQQLACPHIHFLGKVDYDAVPSFLRAADYFLYGSLSETFGNVVCEAKYSKVPVIALDDKAGVRFQIDDKKTGILVAHQDEKHFADRFFELYTNPLLGKSISENAHYDVLTNNNPDRIYSNLMSVYEGVVEGDCVNGEEINRLFTFDRTFIESGITRDRDTSDSYRAAASAYPV